MAYSTADEIQNLSSLPPLNAEVITIEQEKEFVKNACLSGNKLVFEQINTYANIYTDTTGDSCIPLTSVIYTPNIQFLEKSVFFKQINNNTQTLWLKKRNILVLVYGITAMLDTHSQQNYNHSPFVLDQMQVNGGCITTPFACIPTMFKNDTSMYTSNEDIINLIRFENSPYNNRLFRIRDRIQNVYAYNFSPINYLVFHDLNNIDSVNKFLKNTININMN